MVDLPAALNRLAQYEDASERAEKIISPGEVIGVLELEYEHWRDYVPDEYQDELEAARNAVLAFMCCDEDSGCICGGK